MLETEASERRDDGRPSLYINVRESAPELENRCLPRGQNCARGRQAPSGAARLPCRCEAADPQRRRSRCYAFGDVASFAALDQKWITSGTVMVPCPWFTEVAAYAKSHPEADLGLHLTFTSEWDTYRWGPVAPRALVPSLVGPDGYFYADAASLLKHARLDEVETELRAQIELAKSMGLEPTHLDAHMHVLYASPELFGIFQK